MQSEFKKLIKKLCIRNLFKKLFSSPETLKYWVGD